MTAGEDSEYEPVDGGWEAAAGAQRRAWLRTTPEQRLAWLEDALAFAHTVGALDADRRRRAAAARRWAEADAAAAKRG